MTGWRERLSALPSLSLATQPTPLICAKRLSAAIGGPQLWFKRDDLFPAAFGGNKARALDVVIADAKAKGADTLITGAGPLSNHVRASAAIAALSGMHCLAIYWGAAPGSAEGNFRLTKMLGAEIRFTGDLNRESVDIVLETAAAEIRDAGGRPYVVPRGGACPLAALAHVLAVREVLDQCAAHGVAPQVVVLAVGGAATLAGWLLGSTLFDASWRIEAITVSRPAQEASARARALAAEAAAIIEFPGNLERVEYAVHDGFIGAGYGLPSSDGREAIRIAASVESVFLDPVYTGKAMAGYRKLASQGRYDDVASILFIHTGGAPTLFTSAMEEP